jgi:Family of unknown function (DUF6335)
MARKKPARPAAKAKKQAKKKTAPKAAASRKGPRKSAKKSPKKKAAKKAPSKNAPSRRVAGIKAAATKKAAKTVKKAKQIAAAIKAAGTKKAAAAMPKSPLITAVKKLATAAVAAAGVSAARAPKKKPNLDRPRKTVADVHGIPSSLDLDRRASSAKSGRAEMRDKLSKSNSGGAAITAGDVDADWQSAESVGDEAPGGDNPTPDQDRVDDIGRALGVEYADDEELQGGAEIADRDLNRWELDPASKDDFDDDED